MKKDIAYYEEMLRDSNVIAFLQVIREGEGATGEEGYLPGLDHRSLSDWAFAQKTAHLAFIRKSH